MSSMSKLPVAGPSFLLHFIVIIAALLTLPVRKALAAVKNRNA
jgi:hypothetical protein